MPDAPADIRIASPRRRWFFALIALLLAVAAIELGARGLELAAAARSKEADFLVQARNPVPVFEIAKPGLDAVYRRTKFHALMLPSLEFPVRKSERTFRVFLLGGSAAASWPYALGGYSIAELLAWKLRTLMPGRHVEVLNVAAGTYASHRVRFVFDEIVEYEPDLVLIYSGNNEFLEHFVFRPRTPGGGWGHFAIVRIIHRALGEIGEHRPSFDVENYSYADQRSNRLSYAFGKVSRYREDPEQFQELLASYRNNIEWMVNRCGERGIAVMLLNVPVNLKDWVPNVSRHRRDLAPRELLRWQTHFREGVLAIDAGEAQRAAESLEAAIEIDDEFAEAHYRLGAARLALGEVDAAKTAYVDALRRDAYPFRALPEFQEALAEIATIAGVPLVDVVGALEKETADGILGLDVLIDYVHLRASSLEIVAHEILRSMLRSGLLPMRLWTEAEATRAPVPDFGPDMELLEVDSLYRQNLVMRQYDRLDELYERFETAIDKIAEARPDLLELSRRKLASVKRVHRAVRPYRKLLRAEKLGLLEEEFTLERARKVYTRYARVIHELEAPDMPRSEFLELVPQLEYRVDAPRRIEGKGEERISAD